jgi:hypothetical protein
MRRWLIAYLGLGALLLGLASTTAASGKLAPEPVVTAFRLDGSNGYKIHVLAYSELGDGQGRVSISVGRKGRASFYVARAKVTQTTIDADLGSLGRIDVVLHRSGLKREVRFRCIDYTETFEPGVYEGTFRFNGEEGYTRANQSTAPLLAPALLGQGDCNGSGSGEVTGGSDLPGARLRGISFAHGRTMKFQVNKNRPSSKAVFTASVTERRDGVLIGRAVHGTAPTKAFTFDHRLRTAHLGLPPPFSGRAALSRSRDSLQPLWRGDLAVDFLGRSNLALTGPDVSVSLVHARFTRSDGPEAEIGFRSPRGGAWPMTRP